MSHEAQPDRAASQVTVENLPDAHVDDRLDTAVRALLVVCFPHEPRFRRHRHYKEPPLHRWLAWDADALVAHLCVHRKHVGSDRGDLAVAGIAEVCVHPSHRGRGLVCRLLDHAHAWAAADRYDFAMLFGDPRVYASSGYAPIPNPLRFLDDDSHTWPTRPDEAAMIRPLTTTPWPPGTIDLRGPKF